MPQLAKKTVLTLEGAKEIAAAARVEADKNHWHMAIAIVDDGGHLLYLERMDGTQFGGSRIAEEKAASAIRFKRSTKVLEDSVAGGRLVVMKLPGAVPVEGGIPIVVAGDYLGAIGVSGGTSQQDGPVAAAGLALMEKAVT
jgi:glc operon protein GlcG